MAEFTPRVAVILLLIPSVIGAFGQLALTWLIASPGGTPARALAVALRTLPAYLLAVVLITPATTLGLILLVVPGLYLFARFFLIGPVMVIEGAGVMAALRRSWAMTAPAGGTILLFLVLALLFIFGAGVLAGGVGAALGLLFTALGLKTIGGFASALVAAIVSTLFTMASAAAGVVIYRQLA
jgi:membrane-anchored glycerophosphoryl diester phosphodiesterase (GDPDase)